MIDIFVARQPIFDASHRLVGYELLYRPTQGATTSAAAVTDGAKTSDVILNALLGFGVPNLTAGTRAWINFSRDQILRGTHRLFAPGALVVELLETVEPDAEVIDACRTLVADGYTLALDDFADDFDPAVGLDARYAPLLALKPLIKVRVRGRAPGALAALVAALKPSGCQLLAECVETAAERRAVGDLGFDFYQGYFFSRPETMSGRDIPASAITVVRLMALLRDENSTDREIEAILRTDMALCYKLLRMVSAAIYGQRTVETIPQALRLVGRDAFQRWLALIMIASVGTGTGLEREIARTALLRARLCELVAQASPRRGTHGAAFLAGLLSLLDAAMQRPMTELVADLDLAEPIERALVAREGMHGAEIQLVEAFERGAWAEIPGLAEVVGVAPSALPALYVNAVTWSQDQAAALDD